MNLLQVIFAACLLATCCTAQLSATFATKAAESNALALLQKPTTLKAAYYSSKILDALKSKDYSCNCKALSGLFAKETNAMEIFHGLAASKACKCSDVKASAKQAAEIKSALKVRVQANLGAGRSESTQQYTCSGLAETP